MITALAGGIGAARFLEGFVRILDPTKLTIIVNTGDDININGLHISPDIDIIIYTLAGVVDKVKGWGYRGDSFFCLKELKQFGYEDWFKLGDRDLATHIYRAWQLKQGWSLTQVTDSIRKRFRLTPKILPMTNDCFTTKIITDRGELHFQEYLVKRKAKDRVKEVCFEGADKAKPSPGVLESILNTDGIILCPSNPIVSIGTILAVKGVKAALQKTRAKIIAISPIVSGRPIKGPAGKIMSGMGMEVSAVQVAKLYRDFIDIFIMDKEDRNLQQKIESQCARTIVTNTIMKDMRSKIELAKIVYHALKES
jgi:LPPG:FO 2-phospho-L-lactate transferase